MALRRERARYEGKAVSWNPSPLPASAFNMGIRFDSSIGRGDLITPIGVGRVIPGA
jgi:hypothetical protein